MESFDSLIISLIDSDAMKGCFKKELATKLDIDVSGIDDIILESELIDGVISQILKVFISDTKIKKEVLMDVPFKYIQDNCIVFEVGDVVL